MMRIYMFLLLIVLRYSVAENDVEIKMVEEIIVASGKPANLVAFICWSFEEQYQLYSKLVNSKGTLPMTITFEKWGEFPVKSEVTSNVIFLFDLRCPGATEMLLKNDTQRYFQYPYRWIVLHDADSNTEGVPDLLGNSEILIDSEVLIIHRKGIHKFALYYIYKIDKQGFWNIEFYGEWSEQTGLQKFPHFEDITSLRRLNLNQSAEITMCYVLTDPDSINHLEDGVNDHIDTITKVNYQTTNYLLDFLNANRRYIFTGSWGYKNNGSWNGMTGYLVRNEVEIGGSPMFFTTERMSLVDYIASPTPTRSKFVFQQPKLSYENNLFLLSFRSTVWYSILALIFLLFLALFTVAFWEWKKTGGHKTTREKNASILRANITDIVILIFGAACQQGSPVELKGSLGRIVMLILFLALMFLYTSYAANIVALLQSSSSQIRNLEDLLHSRIKFGVHDTIYNRYYFSTATEPIRKAIYKTKVAPPGGKPRFMSMDEGVKNMQKGLFAFHMETGVGYKFVGKYFQEGEKCGLKEIQYLQVIDPWLAVRRNSPYKEMFKIGLKRIQEHGLQNRENTLLYEKRPKCSGRGANFVSVSMVDCYPALLVLTYGTIISIAVMLLEILFDRRRKIMRRINRSTDPSITNIL